MNNKRDNDESNTQNEELGIMMTARLCQTSAWFTNDSNAVGKVVIYRKLPIESFQERKALIAHVNWMQRQLSVQERKPRLRWLAVRQR